MNSLKFAGGLIVAIVAVLIICFLWVYSGYRNACKPRSYLPVIGQFESTQVNARQVSDTVLAKTQWYILKMNAPGDLSLNTPTGMPIFSSIRYYSSCEGFEDTNGLNNISTARVNDSVLKISGTSLAGSIITILLTTKRNLPRIDIRLTTRYQNDVTVNREALILKYTIPVAEVFKKNRRTDIENIRTEYWLDRQGVKFGEGSASALIYHTPGISSLQLNTKDSLLFINLDYFRDHPFVCIPYQSEGGGRWTDCSASMHQGNTEKVDSVSIYAGYIPEAVPRIMLVPCGYVASHVFTEHADGGDRIEPHLAAYFGSDSITDIEHARGGFAGHRIPVTKSVMFCDSAGKLSDPNVAEASRWNRMTSFLDQLNETGLYDICLHTPENLNSDRTTLAEAIPFMKKRYNTISWIDHGMYEGNINRECFVCDGIDPASEFYAADLWNKYDTRYFWSPAVELIRYRDRISTTGELKRLRFMNASEAFWANHLAPEDLCSNGFRKSLKEVFRHLRTEEEELNSLFPGKGENMPSPLYWEHPFYGIGFYSWVTDYVKDYRKLSGSQAELHLKNEMLLIDRLIYDWGIFLNHGYYVRGHEILVEQDGRLEINPYFDRLLGYMQLNQENGSLLNTTVRELMNYWILTENVTFIYSPDGTIVLYNSNDQDIEGLSLAVRAEGVLVDGVEPMSRRYNDDLVFWFDIPAMTGKTIELK